MATIRPASALPACGAPVSPATGLLAGDFRPADAAPYLAAARRTLGGRFDIFALAAADLGFPPDWRRDPLTGTRAPDQFGKRLNYRDESLVGNIKYLWEPARHLELVGLAQAWQLSGDESYLTGCRRYLESWFAATPYPLGPHWVSSLETALRLLNWAAAWQLLGGEASPLFAGADGAAFRQRWLDAIYRHAHFTAGHLSRHSSANNHLLGELLGLLVAGCVWPYWPASAGWLATGERELAAEALRQNSPDGINREQAFYYQLSVATLLLLGGLCLRRHGRDWPAPVWERLHALLEGLRSLIDVGGNIPMVGDSDDALLLRLDPAAACPWRNLLGAGALCFDDPELAAKALQGGWPGDMAGWLYGPGAPARLAELAAHAQPRPPRTVFAEGGYYLLGSRLGQPDEIRLLADAGPLGYLSIAGHGHADALALILSAGGHEYLIDPGTYSYHTEGRWRDYFRGTSAHNTARVDGLDQSVSGGPFMWLAHAGARCLAWHSDAASDRLLAEHDGYQRLPDPLTHRREVVFDKALRQITVTDSFACRGSHQIELFWHAPEHAAFHLAGESASLCLPTAPLALTFAVLEGEAAWRVAQGESDPPLGWISRRFDHKTPCPVLVRHGRITGPTRWVTRLQFLAPGDLPADLLPDYVHNTAPSAVPPGTTDASSFAPAHKVIP